MFRKILSVITFVLILIVLWKAHQEIFDAINYLSNTNIWLILLLIPEQLFMYFCAGQMFFSYMSAKPNAPKISVWELMRISFELNFVNHAIPSGGISGLGYISWRLRKFGATAGQVSFMYALRYTITISANQLQTIFAIIALLLIGGLSASGYWIISVTSLVCVGVLLAIAIAIIIASKKSRVDWFAKLATTTINHLVKFLTFGRKPAVLKLQKVNKYFTELHEDLLIARSNKKMLIRPILWGVVYSFLEVATYWLVASSMGHPEILPQIMVGEAIGSVIGAFLVTPGGVGGYEGSMIAVMFALGVDPGLATAVVVSTRAVVLIGTIVSGYGFYQHAISKIGRRSRVKS